MAPAQSKLTIHPWFLDAPIYNGIRFPQWKIHLYNAAQKMCTFLDITGAFSLVALDTDWDTHPKNAILAVAATANAPAGLSATTSGHHNADCVHSSLYHI